MKLVASMIVRNELGRYLRPVVEHVLSWCDELRVLDDGSTDGTYEYLSELERVAVKRLSGTTWREHEGMARQELLDWTLDGQPTHVLALDADEIVPDGRKVRETLGESRAGVWTLRIVEVWQRDTFPWRIRVDGGWAPTHSPVLYRAPSSKRRHARPWRIMRRELSSGREPMAVRTEFARGHAEELPYDLLHLGWSDPSTREARARRYQELDGGRFHAGEHLDSILWPPERVRLDLYTPPAGLTL